MSHDRVIDFDVQGITMGPGVTLGVFFAAQPTVIKTEIRHVSGGTGWVIPSNFGTTFAAATLVSVQSTRAFFTKVWSQPADDYVFDGSPAFYLAATGSSAFFQVIRHKNALGASLPINN